MMNCRLCAHNVEYFASFQKRAYYRCPRCHLIQLEKNQCPTPNEEFSEYQLHQNDPKDEGYRRFLQKVTDPMLEWLNQKNNQNATTLDFGCGPGPTISIVMGEWGWNTQNYDPFFVPNKSVLLKRYDLISCTEVVEHFHEPERSWAQLYSLCSEEGSQLVVMTQPSDKHHTQQKFQQWRYIHEKSHVAFYHSFTMKWIADHFNMKLSILSPSVFWFSKLKKAL